ncbi:hypothetical protein [Azohydromonas aeria]|uniref:hypothetical protein n=1 Tax=Azohydromonas aeria TaxID=2590212 RepID=UPI0012F97F3F|nr:hypothetical protein [Azohydromonas aeria]
MRQRAGRCARSDFPAKRLSHPGGRRRGGGGRAGTPCPAHPARANPEDAAAALADSASHARVFGHLARTQGVPASCRGDAERIGEGTPARAAWVEYRWRDGTSYRLETVQPEVSRVVIHKAAGLPKGVMEQLRLDLRAAGLRIDWDRATGTGAGDGELAIAEYRDPTPGRHAVVRIGRDGKGQVVQAAWSVGPQ